MNVFVLTTGRSGSLTLSKALSHITNYTCAHESRSGCFDGRLDYPDRHIEVDNRLAFFLGPLLDRYRDAFFVHLTRDRDAVVESFTRRFGGSGIMNAYAHGIIQHKGIVDEKEKRLVAELYVDSANSNITSALVRSGVNWMPMEIDRQPSAYLADLWAEIGAEGDFAAACAELSLHHNAS